MLPGTLNFLTPSEHRCGKCARRDCQQLIQACENIDCSSEELFHQSCLVKHNESGKIFWICDACATSGFSRFGLDEMADKSVSDKDSAPENKPAYDVESVTPSGSRGLVNSAEQQSFWPDSELEVWVRVTMRTAASLKTRPDRLNLLDSRWTAAKPHIPPSKLQDMVVLIQEVREAIEAWPDLGAAQVLD